MNTLLHDLPATELKRLEPVRDVVLGGGTNYMLFPELKVPEPYVVLFSQGVMYRVLKADLETATTQT
jgi:hypothetical protein